MDDDGTPGKMPPAPSASSIIDGETRVGRIYKEQIHGEPKWLWFLQTEPAPPPNSGMASTLEEAKAAFKRRLCRGQGRDVTEPDLTARIADG